MTAVPDLDTCLRAVSSRDRRFDGVFYTAVRTTGIYCRPSCPARTPLPENVSFHPTAASAQHAGYRACRRCLPDATPGSPHWDVAADAAGRAMRLISDGVVDREGVPGLARRLGYSPRHLTRLLTSELGAGPLHLARARRAQTARSLIEATDLPFTDIAFAAGFASVRQFNDTMQSVYEQTPGQLRSRSARQRRGTGPSVLHLRLAVRTPFLGSGLLRFLGPRALPGVEVIHGDQYSRTLALPHGPAVLSVTLPDLPGLHDGTGTATLPLQMRLVDLRDLPSALERTRRLLDADADPQAIAADLGPDPLIGPLIRAWPGLRVPGHVDGAEVAVRAIVGQQVSVAAARTVLSRLVQAHGTALPEALATPGLDRLFPTPAALAGLETIELAMPRSRARALTGICAGLAAGDLALDRGPERAAVREALLAVPGIGPWTAAYLSIRALGDPDAFMPTDIGTRDALLSLGTDPRHAEELAASWRPWRSYAQAHLWHHLLTKETP